MSGLMKVMTCILGVLAVVACLATIGIVGYSMSGAGSRDNAQTAEDTEDVWNTAAAVPTQIPTSGQGDREPESISLPDLPKLTGQEEHVHDYKEEVVTGATCYRAGKIRYYCECGDEYFVDIVSTGHVAGDWEVTRKPTEDRPGIRVQKCIYCDEIMIQENIPFEDETKKDDGDDDEDEEEADHIHQFMAEVEREPSCILAGLRKYTCSCGNFYTEMIPASGHIATDWTVAEEPTDKYMGTEQRTCTECGVVLDSRPINKVAASPSASASSQPQQTSQPTANPSASASARPTGSSGSQATASPSASPSPTPHAHEYRSYVLKTANCTEKGIRSFVCTCGSSYAESIERDLNNHSYRATVVPATRYTAGYTVYTCARCNYSYFDNYTPLITN